MKTTVRLLSSATLLLCGSAFAADDSCKPECKKTCTNARTPDVPLCGVPAAYNIPARIQTCDRSTFFVDASYLYWCVVQDYMDIGTTSVLTDAAMGTAVPANPQQPLIVPNEYQSGFRVGVGTGTTFDDWQLRLEYTYMHHTLNNTFGSAATVFEDGNASIDQNEWFVLAADPAVALGQVTTHWVVNLDALDLSLSRPFYQGKRLTVTPYSGLFGFSLRQNFNINGYTVTDPTAAPQFSNNSSKAWAIGPEIGSSVHWLLCSSFRIEADAMFSLLYTGYYDMNHNEVSGGGTLNGTVPNKGFIRPFFDLSLGLGWGSYYWDSYHFDLLAAYEFVNFSQQNMMRKNVGDFHGYSNPIGDLSYHGLTVTARFDF